MEVAVSIKEMLEAGVHFGHQTKRWNPKMKPYIFEERNGIYIIDLEQSAKQLERACKFAQDVATKGGTFLFVGTKKQAQESVKEATALCGAFYVTERWLGGTLTNNRTIRKSIQRLLHLEEMEKDGTLLQLSKKEASMNRREMAKLLKNLQGIKGMEKLPDALFVIDTKKEHIAITEARKLNIPIIGILDTNSDPDEVDYPVAGNDDAIKAIRLITLKIAEAVKLGKQVQEKVAAERRAEEERAEGEPELKDELTVAVIEKEEDKQVAVMSEEKAAKTRRKVSKDKKE